MANATPSRPPSARSSAPPDWTTIGGFVALAALTVALFSWMRADTHARIDDFRQHLDVRFDGVDTRFDGIDARLDGIDARIDRLDARIDGVEERLAEVGHRMNRLEQRMARQEGLISGIVSVAELPRPLFDPETEAGESE